MPPPSHPGTTLDVLQAAGGRHVLMSLTDGGIQHFLAGARANIGITKGRCMFETITYLFTIG